MKIHEQLTKENWTKGASARDSFGNEVTPSDPSATCFCAYGWLTKVYGDGPSFDSAWGSLCRAILEIDDNLTIGRWNDSSTFEEVKDTFIELNL